MANKAKGVALKKFHYRCSGLSRDWKDWFEIEGEVFAEDEETVKNNIQTLVDYDYNCSAENIHELLVSIIAGTYLWPPGDTVPSIIYDDGPLPSWLQSGLDDPLIYEDKKTSRFKEPEPVQLLPQGTYISATVVQPSIESEFTNTIDKAP